MNDEWTHITDDPATLPDMTDGLAWCVACWTDGKDTRAKRSVFEQPHDESAPPEWFDMGGGSDLTDRGWRVYAWRPWPTPPPIEASE